MEINGMLMGVDSWGGHRTEKPSSGSEGLDRGQLALPASEAPFQACWPFLEKDALSVSPIAEPQAPLPRGRKDPGDAQASACWSPPFSCATNLP